MVENLQSALTSEWWIQMSTKNIAHSTRGGSGKNLRLQTERIPKVPSGTEREKRSQCRLHGCYWEGGKQSLPGPQWTDFTWTNLPHDVPKRSNDSITSSFPPTGTLHYVAKKEILHRTQPIWLAEHQRLQTSFPAHSTNPMTSRSHTEALTSSGDLPASVLRKACILPGACKTQTMFTSTVWELQCKGSYCMKKASAALLPPFLLGDTRQLNWAFVVAVAPELQRSLVTVPSAGFARHTHLLPSGVLKPRKHFWLISENGCESFFP